MVCARRIQPGFPISTSVSRIIYFSCPRQERICDEGANEISGVSSAGFRCLTNPAHCCVIIFSDTASQTLLRLSLLCPRICNRNGGATRLGARSA